MKCNEGNARYVHGRDVVLMHIQGRVELTHVEGVAVVVLRGGGKIEGLHGVPREGIRAHLWQ